MRQAMTRRARGQKTARRQQQHGRRRTAVGLLEHLHQLRVGLLLPLVEVDGGRVLRFESQACWSSSLFAAPDPWSLMPLFSGDHARNSSQCSGLRLATRQASRRQRPVRCRKLAHRVAPRQHLLHLRQLLRDVQVRAAQRLHLPLPIVAVHLQPRESCLVSMQPAQRQRKRVTARPRSPFSKPQYFSEHLHRLQ